ncbi:MAG: FAD-dependent oxidoreductase [Bacillota bacterium]|jgi:heterodisulfide reductase subunit A
MKYPIIIIGGGIAGMAAALEIAKAGLEVLLIEKNESLGGQAAAFACMATNQCQKCGACFALQLKAEVATQPKIKVMTSYEVIEVAVNAPTVEKSDRKSSSTQYLVKMQLVTGKPDNSRTSIVVFRTEVVLIASGYQPFSAEVRGEYGYGRYLRVVTSLDLEQVWRKHGNLKSAYGHLSQVAFIQCIGSRDRRTGNPYCSKVCCGYSWRMARRMQWDYPEVEINIFYMDFQGSRCDFLSDLNPRRLNNKKISLVRSIPSRAYQLPGQKVVLDWEATESGQKAQAEFDLVVLSVGIVASDFNYKLNQQLNFPIDKGGFLLPGSNCRERPQGDLLAGVFCAGTCSGAADIWTTIIQGKSIAGQIVDFLNSNH